MEDAEINALVTQVAARALPEPAPVIDPNSRFILRSHAIFDSAPESDPEFLERQRTWAKQRQQGDADAPGIVGPFEVELPSLVPIEKFVTPDLAEINKLVEKDAVIKANMTQRKVIVSFPEEAAADNDAKQRHSEVWKRVLGWNELVGNGRDITLCEHLSLVLERD